LSVKNQLGQLISVLKKGFSGNKRPSTYKPTKFGAIDLSEENIPNKLNIHSSSYGVKETFATDTLAVESYVSCIPRYFRFGPNVRITVQNQLDLLGHVAGDARQGLDEEIRKRRQQTWKGWYDCSNENGHPSFEKDDLPDIARKFAEFWDVSILDTKEGRLDPPILRAVAKEIRALLEACNKVVSRSRQGGHVLVDVTLYEKDDFVSPPAPCRTQKKRRLNDDSVNEVAEPVAVVTPTRNLPPCLKLDSLRSLLVDDRFDELAAIEYAIELQYKQNLKVTDVTVKFDQTGVNLPTSITLQDIQEVSMNLKAIAWRHLSTVRASAWWVT
jgi:hypothetical protein